MSDQHPPPYGDGSNQPPYQQPPGGGYPPPTSGSGFPPPGPGSGGGYPPPPVPQAPPTINISATAVSTPGVARSGTKDPTAAILLELLPAISLQTFGIGNIYAGNVLVGVLIMVGYWITCLVNIALCFILIGLVTWPLTWLAFAVGSSYLAYQKAKATPQS